MNSVQIVCMQHARPRPGAMIPRTVPAVAQQGGLRLGADAPPTQHPAAHDTNRGPVAGLQDGDTTADNGHVMRSINTDVLVVGAGPAGSAAATWSARLGLDTWLVDGQDFPRDKACGDGLTPRAIAEMRRLGMSDWLNDRPKNLGLRASGFGRTWHLPWPGGSLPATGSAASRYELDSAIFNTARESGANTMTGVQISDVTHTTGGRVELLRGRLGDEEVEIAARRIIIADGARSTLGRKLGRVWHKDTVYGVAARAYVDSGRATDPWISSDLELRGSEGQILSGYGWIFPLGAGKLNLGVGTLATNSRPANINLRKLLRLYYELQREDWDLMGQPKLVRSALLPMGGAVGGVAGPNWLLIGDAAGCINPLNGEGIDYGLETGRLAAELCCDSGQDRDLTQVWPTELTTRYGGAFSAARRIAALLTQPDFLRNAGPVGMRSRALMMIALRVMGNLVTPEDKDILARTWRITGRASVALDERPPFLA